MPRQKQNYKIRNEQAYKIARRNQYRCYPIVEFRTVNGQCLKVVLDLGFNETKTMIIQLFHIVAPKLRTVSAEEKHMALIAQRQLDRICRKAQNLHFIHIETRGKKPPCGIIIGSDCDESINDQLLNGGFVWCSTFKSFDLDYLIQMQTATAF